MHRRARMVCSPFRAGGPSSLPFSRFKPMGGGGAIPKTAFPPALRACPPGGIVGGCNTDQTGPPGPPTEARRKAQSPRRI